MATDCARKCPRTLLGSSPPPTMPQWTEGGLERLVGSSSFSSYYGTTELTPQVSPDSFLGILHTSCLVPQVHPQSSTHTLLQGASKPFVAVSGTVPSNSTSAFSKRPVAFGEWQGKEGDSSFVISFWSLLGLQCRLGVWCGVEFE